MAKERSRKNNGPQKPFGYQETNAYGETVFHVAEKKLNSKVRRTYSVYHSKYAILVMYTNIKRNVKYAVMLQHFVRLNNAEVLVRAHLVTFLDYNDY